jgi:putative RNA 2'-phosphotransferase
MRTHIFSVLKFSYRTRARLESGTEMKNTKSIQKLAKFTAYILERRPDEFGLVIDSEGYIKIKELLKAINEEKGFRHVRRSHLNEILYSIANSPFEITDNRIRATHRDLLPRTDVAQDPPKLLYTYIRRKAHATVSDNGIFPSGYHQVVLAARRELAERMGKRSDPQPVILTVHVKKSLDKGVRFYQAGELLFLAASIPPDCFSGPALPQEKPEKLKQGQPQSAKQPEAAGSFSVDLDKAGSQKRFGGKSKKMEGDWKGKKRRIKKQKRKRERPPWRR